MNKGIKILLTLAVLGGITGVLIWKFYIQKPIKNVKNEAADATVSAVSIFDEVKRSDTTAQRLYMDKVLQISGAIKGVEAIGDSATIIEMGDSLNTIVCQVDARNNSSAKLVKRGDTVKVKGRITALTNEAADPNLADLGIPVGIKIEMKDCNVENK
jgi:hypothetical protein